MEYNIIKDKARGKLPKVIYKHGKPCGRYQMEIKEKYTLKQNFYNALIDMKKVETSKELESVYKNICDALLDLKKVCSKREMDEYFKELQLITIDLLAEGV